jgi:hypothetical protein
MMIRYRPQGGGMGQDDVGEWVRYEDAQQIIDALRRELAEAEIRAVAQIRILVDAVR